MDMFLSYLDENETQMAFRKHFDDQLELYKTVVSSLNGCYLLESVELSWFTWHIRLAAYTIQNEFLCFCIGLILIFFPQAVISLVDQTGREKVRLHVDD